MVTSCVSNFSPKLNSGNISHSLSSVPKKKPLLRSIFQLQKEQTSTRKLSVNSKNLEIYLTFRHEEDEKYTKVKKIPGIFLILTFFQSSSDLLVTKERPKLKRMETAFL